MGGEILELMLFSRSSERVEYRRRTDEFSVELLFEKSRWYRLVYRRDLDYTDPDGYRAPTEFVFLEHPVLPGVAIGFRHDTFLNHG